MAKSSSPEVPRDGKGFTATFWLLFAAVFLSAVCLHHPNTGYNVNTRLVLVFAVADQGTLTIDDYHDLEPYATGDKAFYEGHYYSDKIFGVSLLALPFYWGMKGLWAVAGGAEPTFQQANYVLRVFAVSAPAALAASLLWLLSVRLGAAPRRALLAVGFAVFGSIFFGYATIFMPYAPGVAAALGALYLLLYPPARRLTARNSIAIGGLCGVALLSDLLFVFVVWGLIAVFLLRLQDQVGLWGLRAFADMSGDRTRWRGAVGIAAAGAIAGAIPLALFAAYSIAIFGSPTIPYEYEADPIFREGMAAGVMGATLPPKAHALWFLTLHPFRGLFFWTPVMALAVAGLVMGVRSAGRRRLVGWLGLWVFVSYLLFNACYYMWWAGWTMGPRLLLPIWAVVPLGLAELCRRDRPRWLFAAVCVAGTVGVLLTMPLSILDPQIPQGNPHEVLQNATLTTDLAVPQFVYLGAFWTGQVFERAGAWWGLRAVLSLLLPVVLIGVAWRRAPDKSVPDERLETPFKTVDGAAAPPPPPMAVR
ncbi:MAG: hypothetical protein RLY93_01290 [Sumerlaeia bacterium]